MKVYLAAPFFTDKQKNDKSTVKAALTFRKDVEILDPQDFDLGLSGWEMTNHQWGKKVFDADVKALLEADAVVAIDYGLYSDTGTAWEIGYAYGACIPVITLVPDETVPTQHSLMVCSSSEIFCSIKRFCNELTIQTFKEFLETGNQYNLLGVELK